MNIEEGYDFPVISEGDEERRFGPDLAEAGFGETVVHEETIYREVDGDWRKGERGDAIGTVTLSQTPTSVRGRVLLHAWFVFDDGETAEFSGLVPGEGSWQGKGRLGWRGGTGRFGDRRGEITVESSNPKRWG
ncbi:MAG TPA: hypothetical protein VEA19_02000 [Actinomycetota bacterium]|nr:hypothetical protein [Actinomycetota bacterium]